MSRFDEEPMLYGGGPQRTMLRSGAPFLSGNRERVANAASQTGLWILILLGLAIAIAGLTIGIVVLIRTNERHKGLSSRIHEARDASDPIGFSVYKNATQDVDTGVPTNLGEWAYADGSPAYDASAGAVDLDTGVFTASMGAYYIATGTVCFNTTAANGTLEAHLMTNGTASAVVFARETPDADIEGDQCLGLHQIMWLPVGSEVWLMALHTTGSTEMVTTESRFGVERIAV